MKTIRYIYKPCLFVGLVIGILMCHSVSFGQGKEKPTEVVDQTYKRIFTFFCSSHSSYVLVGQSSNKDEFTFYIDESNSADPMKGEKFIIKPLDPIEFENSFVDAFEKLIASDTNKDGCLSKNDKDSELRRKAQSLFFDVMKSVLKPGDDKPVAASILVHHVVPILKPHGVHGDSKGQNKFARLSSYRKAQVGKNKELERIRSECLNLGDEMESTLNRYSETPIPFSITTKDEAHDQARIAESKVVLARSKVLEAELVVLHHESELKEIEGEVSRAKEAERKASDKVGTTQKEADQARRLVALSVADEAVRNELEQKAKLAEEKAKEAKKESKEALEYLNSKESEAMEASVKLTTANAFLKQRKLTLIDRESESLKATEAAEELHFEDQWYKEGGKEKNRLSGEVTMMRVDSVQFEFNNGFIETISVVGKFNNHPFEFTNGIPIGISTAKNIDKMDNYWLYEDNYDEYILKLSDVFKYTKKVYLDGRDYSPGNGTLVVVTPTTTPVKVYKEATKNLLEAKVFSDFVGVGEENPNGLIQTEISKKIPIVTRRHSYGDPRGGNNGWFQYIEPFAHLSKVENKNRRITPPSINRMVNGEVDRNLYTSSLNILRHENFRAGTSLNLLLWDIPPLKLHFTINGELAFGRTAFRDSTVSVASNGEIVQDKGIRDFGVNTIDLTPMTHLNLLWKPDHRYSFSASYRFHVYLVPDNRITTVANESTFLEASQVGNPLLLNQFQFLVEVRPKGIEFGKFFGRYRFNSQVCNFNTNFHQAQLGYSFFIFQR